MTEYIASSEAVGRRPRISRMRWYSSGLRPSSAHGWSWEGSSAAIETVSSTGVNLPARDGAGVGGLLQETVGHDLEQRPHGLERLARVVGDGRDPAHELAHTHRVDVVAQGVLLVEPVDDALRRGGEHLALGADRGLGIAQRRGDLGRSALVDADQ